MVSNYWYARTTSSSVIEKYLCRIHTLGNTSMPTAFVFINTESASMPAVLKSIKAVKGVEEAEMVYGVYDIVVKVKTETMDELKHIIAFKIRTLANVRSTQTMLVTHEE